VSWPAGAVNIQAYGGGCVMDNINISGNYIGVVQNIGIYVDGVPASNIHGLHIVNNRFFDMSGNTCIYLYRNVRDSVVLGNTHATIGGGAASISYMIVLNGDCDWLIVQNNIGRATVGAVNNGSTGGNISNTLNFFH
jgi:hypothetical protein